MGLHQPTFKAAEKGDSDAHFRVEAMHHDGEGVPPNYTEELEWYHKVAEQVDTNAHKKIGCMYRSAAMVPQGSRASSCIHAKKHWVHVP